MNAGEHQGEYVAINMDPLMSPYKKAAVPMDFIMTRKCCIFKTPRILFRHNEKAYVPDAFSVGPWHFGKEYLTPTQKIKAMYLERLIGRFPSPDEKLAELEHAVKEMREEAKECYGSPIHVSDEVFEKILVLDGCFIIEFFRKFARKVKRDSDDPMFGMPSMLQLLRHDLLLLENQIPWLVLRSLFEKTEGTTDDNKPLHMLAIQFYDNLFSMDGLLPGTDKLFENEDIKHIVDLIRKCLVLPLKAELKSKESEPQFGIPSATRLREAGVKLIGKPATETRSILDITFNNGTLAIPRLLIDEITETVFRNLISFEQCYYNCSHEVTNYAKFLDNLIDTTSDVEILGNEILRNWMNPADATQYFNKLYNDTGVVEFHYNDIIKEVNLYCQRWWPKWRAALIHNYFCKPWAIAAVVYGLIILILTILQVVLN